MYSQQRATQNAVPDTAVLRSPEIADGVRLWELAKDSQVLDVNSSYSYLLWCRDFADTSIVAESDGDVVGFVTGFVRPQSPTTLFVWQVAVDHAQRGRGLGVAMLNQLLDNVAQQSVSTLETTISPDNTASIAMFTSLAKRRGSAISRQPLFSADDFPESHEPDSHQPEDLYTVGPTDH
jgi:L-2,4-diaminobutyric acid acetyltransferase